MTEKTLKLDRLNKLIENFRTVGFKEAMISANALDKLIDFEKQGLCDGGCIALSDLPPCQGCCISSSPGIVDLGEEVINPAPRE